MQSYLSGAPPEQEGLSPIVTSYSRMVIFSKLTDESEVFIVDELRLLVLSSLFGFRNIPHMLFFVENDVISGDGRCCAVWHCFLYTGCGRGNCRQKAASTMAYGQGASSKKNVNKYAISELKYPISWNNEVTTTRMEQGSRGTRAKPDESH